MHGDPLSATQAVGASVSVATVERAQNVESSARDGGLRGAGHAAARVGGGDLASQRAPTVTLHIVGPDGSKSPLKIKLSDDVSTLRALVTQMHDTADWTTQTDRREDRQDFSGGPHATGQLNTGSLCFPHQIHALDHVDPGLTRAFCRLGRRGRRVCRGDCLGKEAARTGHRALELAQPAHLAGVERQAGQATHDVRGVSPGGRQAIIIL